MANNNVVLPGRKKGAASGCPFCKNTRFGPLQVGIRFRLLSGFQSGRTGIVTQSPAPPPLPPTELIAQMDGDPADIQMRILPTEIVEPAPFPTPPEWAPPISLRAACELDSVIVRFCEAGLEDDRWAINWPFYNEVIRFSWYRRLPIEPDELWPVLRAHGVPYRFKTELLDFFVKGRDLLVHACGRKPVKKKRVKPLSIV